MIEKIKRHLFIFSSVIMLLTPVMLSSGIAAADITNCSTNTANQAASGANQAVGGSGVDCSDTQNSVGGVAKNIVNILSFVVGAIAVIMIVYGGFRYITSGGSSEGVGNAKNVIIYAIVGLVIVALAQLIVHFVLNQSSQALTG